MGRFDSTAATYARYCEPYPSGFFRAVADQLPIRGDEALIDLGTGPGVLALGFQPYVRSVVGVDPEPAMLEAARRAAADEGIELPLIGGRTEDLPHGIGPFEIITIGRALHWMAPSGSLAAFDRILAPDGHILICGPKSAGDGANPWHEAMESVVDGWSGTNRDRHAQIYAHFFDDSAFVPSGRIDVAFTQPITVDDLVERALTRSSSSPEVLGPRVAAFRQDLAAALAPFFTEGPSEEHLTATARIFRRRRSGPSALA